MPDPPPYGFHSEFVPHGIPVGGDQGQHYSGVELSYAMPMPTYYTESTTPDNNSTNGELLPAQDEQGIPSSGDSDSGCSHILLDYMMYPPIGYCWQMLNSEDSFPAKNAVRAGRDQDGDIIYVGRAFHEGDMIPAKVIPNKQAAFISYGGEEVRVHEFEILRAGDFVWEFAANGEIPEGAIEVGRTAEGEKLYMGRCLHQGSQTPGKIHPTHGCLYIPFNGEEISFPEYEVLVVK